MLTLPAATTALILIDHEHGYAVVLAEDAMASGSADMHAFAVERIFPSLGRVVKTGEIELQR